MTCRHGAYDPSCSSYKGNIQQLKDDYAKQILGSITPDASNFEIEDVQEIYGHLLLKVKYPNCSNCSYEGTKILVYLNTTIKTAFLWKRIDPHFRDTKPTTKADAPGPDARFPASDAGWENAKAFCLGDSPK